MSWPARPTVYRGIQMRSRLEADFARWLDDTYGPERWEYEPSCFGSQDGQYLPDFLLRDGAGSDYIEIKPLASLIAAADTGPEHAGLVDGLLRKMEVIWESEPQANLKLVGWEYGTSLPRITFHAAGGIDRLWLVFLTDFPLLNPLLWSGRGQWPDLAKARGVSWPEGRRP